MYNHFNLTSMYGQRQEQVELSKCIESWFHRLKEPTIPARFEPLFLELLAKIPASYSALMNN